MKARLFKIIIAAQFDQDVDETALAENVMKSLQNPLIPSGAAKVMVQPIDAQTNQAIPISSLN